MVDSYEIYGENLPEDSDIEAVDEMVHVSNKRADKSAKTSSVRPGVGKQARGISHKNESIEGVSDQPLDDIMISGE
jgi:hypothetical protein